METYITIHKTDSQWESTVGSSDQVLCDNLERQDVVGGGGKFKKERTYVHLWLIHVDIWQ